MISKGLLSRSLSSVYKELLFEEDNATEVEKLKEEVYEVATNAKIFSKEEIEENKESLKEIEKIATHRDFTCHTDGAVVVEYDNIERKEGKQVRAGAAFIIETEDEVLFQNYFSIPSQYGEKDTNSHIAEYQGLISCLRTLKLYHPMPQFVNVEAFTDSQVMSKQMTLEYRVRDIEQKKLRDEALELVDAFRSVTFTHIDRSKNKRANDLAHKSVQEKEWVKSNNYDEIISNRRV